MAGKEKIVDIKFINENDRHDYFDSEGTQYTPVTSVIEGYSDDYDDEYWAVYRSLDQAKFKIQPVNVKRRKIAIYINKVKFVLSIAKIKQAIKNGSLNLGKSYKQIQKEWDDNAAEACAVGSEKHDYIEECINNFYKDGKEVKSITDTIPKSRTSGFPFDFVFAIRTIDDIKNSPLKDSDPKVYNVLTKAIKKGFTLYAEVRVYSYYYKVCGTIDVFAVRGKEFVIIDWKTNKDELKFYSGYYKKVWNATRTEKVKTKTWVTKDERYKYPISHLQVCKGNNYTIQLSLYAALAERWGYKCIGLVLCHLLGVRNPDKSTKIYGNIKYLKEEVTDLLEHQLDKKKRKVVKRVIR